MMLITSHEPGRMLFGTECKNKNIMLPLNLAYIAALTPDNWKIDIIDEKAEPAIDDLGNILFDSVDLVCITVVTHQAPRAYEIANACRKIGMTVIVGGVHPSIIPDEAGRYADSVFIGEAEEIWPQVIRDFEEGKLKKFYRGGLPDINLINNVRPNRKLFKNKYDYKYSPIITTKGCPNTCDFCSVPTFSEGKYRERNYNDVLDEIESVDCDHLLFTDDNFYGHSNKSHIRARNIFKGMIERGINKTYLGMTTIDIANDEETLNYMALSGCAGIFIGIESTNKTVLRNMNKKVNLKIGIDSYSECIKKIHDAGIIVWGSVIFGSDGDDKDSFKKITDFVIENNIDIFTFGISCPFPKTQLYARLDKEKRIFRKNYPEDWKYYDTMQLVNTLSDMTLKDFVEGIQYVYDNTYKDDNIRKRFRNSIKATNNRRNSSYATIVSSGWKLAIEQILCDLKELYNSSDYYHNINKKNKMEKCIS